MSFPAVIACRSVINTADPKSCLVGDELAKKNWNVFAVPVSPPKTRYKCGEITVA